MSAPRPVRTRAITIGNHSYPETPENRPFERRRRSPKWSPQSPRGLSALAGSGSSTNMRVARMGYAQRVTRRNEQGRVTSSRLRVRIVVPPEVSPYLPRPYTGLKHLTKNAENDRERAEWTARFLA